MKQNKYFRYLGTNGYIETSVELPGVYHTAYYQLVADEGKVLFDGEQELSSVIVPEREVSDWTEIDK